MNDKIKMTTRNTSVGADAGQSYKKYCNIILPDLVSYFNTFEEI